MTPACSIGEALRVAMLRDKPIGWQHDLACHGPLAPIQLVPDDVLMAKYPHGAILLRRDPDYWVPIRNDLPVQEWQAATLSLDQLREAVTVGGKCDNPYCDNGRNTLTWDSEAKCPTCHGTGREFTVCEKHRAMLKGDPESVFGFERPQVRLTDLLRVECPECAHWHSPHIRAPACGRCGRIPPDDPVLIPHPALTDAMEWAERLGLDREKVF